MLNNFITSIIMVWALRFTKSRKGTSVTRNKYNVITHVAIHCTRSPSGLKADKPGAYFYIGEDSGAPNGNFWENCRWVPLEDLSTDLHVYRQKKIPGEGSLLQLTRKFSRGMKQEYHKTQKVQLYVFMEYTSLG